MNKVFFFIKGRLASFRFAVNGLIDLFYTQPNAQVHLVATTSTIILGLTLGLTSSEWCILILSISAVLSAEALNTALEYLTDLVSPEYHPLAGKAKDVAAAAVLITALAAVTIGTIIFLPKALNIIY